MGWPCKQKRKDFQSKLYLPKQIERDHLNDQELHGPITLRILDRLELLETTPNEMMDVIEDREMWRLNHKLLPLQPSRKSRQ